MPNLQAPVIAIPSPEHDIKCAIQKCDQKSYDIPAAKNRCAVLGTKKHTCVKETLQQKSPACQCEQPFDMRTNPPTPVTSSPGKGLGRRPDVVVGGPSPASYDVYDAKFPCSDDVRSGKATSPGPMPSAGTSGANFVSASSKEQKDYVKIANGGKSKALTPEDCKNEKCE